MGRTYAIHSRSTFSMISTACGSMLSGPTGPDEAWLMTYERNRALGRYGERVAADHLQSLGMVVLARNWRCRFGEIDLVARDGSTLVICEVKTRTGSTHGSPVEAVVGRKATRLRRLAAHWLEVHGVEPLAVRIDVVSVVVPTRGAPHVERVTGVA
jgi:putative endonuclease